MAILARPSFVSDVRVAPTSTCAEDAAERARLTMLYAAHGARIHRFLRDLLRDAALAADATQETFVRAYKKLPELVGSAIDRPGTDDERIVPWLFGVARHVSLEVRRGRARAGRHVITAAPGAFDAAAQGSPESEYLGRESLRVVTTALAQLPEERRAMLLLRLDHGLSYDDIATTMGVSLAKVKVEIFRAREVLRAVMADYEQPRRAR